MSMESMISFSMYMWRSDYTYVCVRALSCSK